MSRPTPSIVSLNFSRPRRLRGVDEAKPIWAGPVVVSARAPRFKGFVRRLLRRITGAFS